MFQRKWEILPGKALSKYTRKFLRGHYMLKKNSGCLLWLLQGIGTSVGGFRTSDGEEVEEIAHTRLIPKQNPLGIHNLGFLLFCWPCLPR
jgi:hypothetical protein